MLPCSDHVLPSPLPQPPLPSPTYPSHTQTEGEGPGTSCTHAAWATTPTPEAQAQAAAPFRVLHLVNASALLSAGLRDAPHWGSLDQQLAVAVAHGCCR